MKSTLLLLLTLTTWSENANALKLKAGDIILQSNPCYLCSLIEAEEKSTYSHMGILVLFQGTWSVLESWEKVKITSLEEFIARRRKETHSLIIRASQPQQPLESNNLLMRYTEKFLGLSYDPAFLWTNSDPIGEKLYCSEFVLKFIQPYLAIQMKTKPMHFDINRDYWIRYFHGTPPDGQPGISPGDFERSPLFRHIGYL
jgi:hypothetical protein